MRNILSIAAGLLLLFMLPTSCTKMPGNDYYDPSFPEQEDSNTIPTEGKLCYFLVQYNLAKASDVESKYEPEPVYKSFKLRIDVDNTQGEEHIVNNPLEIPLWSGQGTAPGDESRDLYPVPFIVSANDDYADRVISVYVAVDKIYTNSVLAHEWGDWQLVYTAVQAGKEL